MKRVLVTGGAGMIGRRVVAALQQRGIDVAVIDTLASGLAMPEGLALASNDDIRDADRLVALCRNFRPDGIVHLAAVHHIPTCETRRSHCLDVNVTGTENVLRAAEEAGTARIAIASSGAVYAWAEGALEEDTSRTEARDNYALSKLCNESQLRFWCERGAGIGRAARIFNTLGNDDPNAHLIPDIVAQLQRVADGEATVLLGNLSPRRDYVHAEDVAAGLLAILADHRTDVPFDLFNLCSGTEHSVEAIVRAVATTLGRAVRIEVDDNRKRRVDRPSQLGNASKIQNQLGWRARCDLLQSIRMALDLA